MTEKIEISDIIKIKESNSDLEANRYLELGWKLINVLKRDYGDPAREHYYNTYVLGWSETSGEIKYPKY